MSATAVAAAAILAAVVGGLVAAAFTHHGYAWRGYQAARKAVPVARAIWLARLGTLFRIGALVVVVLALVWVISKGPQK